MSEHLSEYHQEVLKALVGGSIPYAERFTIYFPNKGRAKDNEQQVLLADWNSWVRRVLDLLGMMNGGATASAIASGFYLDKRNDAAGKELTEKVWEKTILVFTHTKRDPFKAGLQEIHDFLHEFGRETNQGGVMFEFDGFVYEIKPPYDEY